jgi:hypothetical protein
MQQFRFCGSVALRGIIVQFGHRRDARNATVPSFKIAPDTRTKYPRVGSCGRAAAPHFHFSIESNQRSLDAECPLFKGWVGSFMRELASRAQSREIGLFQLHRGQAN